jgi:hypothetical protein
MIPIALKALPWRSIALGIGAAALLASAYGVGRGHGRAAEHDRLMPQIDRLSESLGSCRASNAALEDALDEQSDAIDALAARGQAMQRAVQEAEKRALEARKASAGVKARLAAERPSAGTVAALTAAQAEAWEVLK